MKAAGHQIIHRDYLDTLKIEVKDLNEVKKRAEEMKMNFRLSKLNDRHDVAISDISKTALWELPWTKRRRQKM